MMTTETLLYGRTDEFKLYYIFERRMRLINKDPASYSNINEVPVMLTVEEFGKLLRISRNTAYDYVRSGVVPSVRVGKQIRIFRDDVFALRRFGDGPHAS